MKIKILIVGIFLILTFPACNSAQIKITPNKVVYQRTEKEIPEHKKTFEVIYPKITGNGSIKEIENTINYWKVFDITLQDEMEDYYLGSMYYKVNYNDKGILDIELTRSGSAAYPSETVKTLVIDINTGECLKIADVFQNRTKLYNKIAQSYQQEKNKAQAEIKINEKDRYEELAMLFEETEVYHSIYEIDEFSVDDKGVTFIFNYDFIHARKVFQPEGRYFFTWTELKPYIKRGGLLEKFIR